MDLNQVTVSSNNVERSIRFYQKLGLKLIVKSLPNYARFICPNGNSTFSLHYNEDKVVSTSIWIYFECNNLDQLVFNLKKEDIVFESDPEDKPWLWREARLKDPNQHTIILYSAGKNRVNPPWRVN